MEKTYVIVWKARKSGRTGQGTKHLDRQEANALAAELNEQFPEYEHMLLNTADPEAKPLPPSLVQPLTSPAQAVEGATTSPKSDSATPQKSEATTPVQEVPASAVEKEAA